MMQRKMKAKASKQAQEGLVEQAKKGRPWEVWQDPDVAETVDNYWTGSEDELEYRSLLAHAVKQEAAFLDSILEVGSGTGLVYGALKQEGIANYVGIDNSNHMLAKARDRYPEADFRFGDAFDLDMASGSYDVVICFEVLGHMPDPSKVIEELLRVARKKVIFTVWLGGDDKAVAGKDHYTFPSSLVESWVKRAMGKEPFVGEWNGMPYTAAYTVTKL